MLKAEQNDYQFVGNGWTKYQQLVLNELQRHEEKLDGLEKEIISLKMSYTRLETELKNSNELLSRLLMELRSVDGDLKTRTASLNTEREKMANELSGLKWKLGALAGIAATIFSAVVQTAIKFFLHS